MELEVGEVSPSSFEFAFLKNVDMNNIGEVFRLQAQIIVVEMTGARPAVKPSEVLIEDIRPTRTSVR